MMNWTIRKRISQKLLWAFLFVMLLVVISPIMWVVLGAFKTNSEIFGNPFAWPESWSFNNIWSAWRLGNFSSALLNSAAITIGGMLLILITACPAGYVLAQIRFKGSNLLFYFFLLGMAIPVQSVIIPIFYQLKRLGLINTLTGITLVSVALALPFSVFLMRNSFRDIPKDIREAAIVDGANEWKSFLLIMLPIAKPGIVALMVFTFMNIWNDFMLPLVLLISSSKFTLALALYSFNQDHLTEYSLIFGGTLISMVPSIIVYILFQRHFTSGMSAGAGK